MSTTHETPGTADTEARLRAALAARAELVGPEDLAPIAPVVPLRPRWQSPWVLLATAAVVLLVLGAVFQGVTGRPRSDDVAPRPDEQQVEPPEDVGRDWIPDTGSAPVRLDLDGDGKQEVVDLLAEPTEQDDGRIRAQTTLTSTGDEAWGLVGLASTAGVGAMEPIDADGDGDQELVLYSNDVRGPLPERFEPAVVDLRDGLLAQVEPSDPDLLAGGKVQVPGSETDHYDLFHQQSYFVDDGTLVSTRSVDTFARALGSGIVLTPETFVADRYEWTLDDEGALQPGEPSCVVWEPEAPAAPCSADSRTDLPYVTSQATETIGVGEQVALEDGGLGYSVRLEAGDPPTIVVDGPGADGLVFALDLPDPRITTTSPVDLVGEDPTASLLVTSASDPDAIQVVVQTADRAGLVALDPVGEVPFGTGTTDDGHAYRSWLTGAGVAVTVVAEDDGSWEAWRWVRAGEQEMAALPWGAICFDDVEDPTTGRAC